MYASSLWKNFPAIQSSPEEKSGAAVVIGFIDKGLCGSLKKPIQPN